MRYFSVRMLRFVQHLTLTLSLSLSYVQSNGDLFSSKINNYPFWSMRIVKFVPCDDRVNDLRRPLRYLISLRHARRKFMYHMSAFAIVIKYYFTRITFIMLIDTFNSCHLCSRTIRFDENSSSPMLLGLSKFILYAHLILYLIVLQFARSVIRYSPSLSSSVLLLLLLSRHALRQ